MENKTSLRRAFSIGITVLTALIFALAVVILGITIHAKIHGRDATFFGYSYSIVLTGSMEPEIHVGELVSVKICEIDEAEIGDNAVYYSSVLNANVIHKVIEIGEDEKGIYIVTQGVANPSPDEPVYAADFVGIGVKHSVFMGGVVRFFSRPLNWVFIAILLACIGVAVHMIKKLVLYVKEDENEGETHKKDGEIR